MTAMLRRLCSVLLLVVAGLVASATPGWAHPRIAPPAEVTEDTTIAADAGPPPEWRAPAPAPATPWLATAALAISLLAASRRPRRAVAIAVASILVLFAFEHGVHSVHHLDDRSSASTCVVASAAAQLCGTPVDAQLGSHIALPLLHLALPDPSLALDRHSGLAHQGRAPPAAA
jgi:hypothetical protein